MQKDFENWHKVKTEIQAKHGAPSFKNREIWWCKVGVNVGDEEDGKGVNFNHPVLVVRKFNKRILWGVPLTTQVKNAPSYHKINFKNKIQCVMLTQLKLLDNKRLMKQIGKLTIEQFDEIREKLKELI